MKRAFFTGLLIFSLALNLAVGLTVAWHLWEARGAGHLQVDAASPLTRSEFREVRRLWQETREAPMRERMGQIAAKHGEILDLIATSPDHPQIADKALNELVQLKAQTETECIRRISQILTKLPPEKRQTFLAFVRNRACMGAGMGFGRGGRPGGKGCCPISAPPDSK